MRSLAAVLAMLLPTVAFGQARLDDHGFPLPEGAVARLGDLHFAQQDAIEAMALSSDGKIIASAGRQAVYLWDADKGRIVRQIETPETVTALTFSRNGKFVAGAIGGEIFVWSSTTGKLHWRTPRDGWTHSIKAMRFVANDGVLAASISTRIPGVAYLQLHHVQLWDVATGTLQRDWTMEYARKELLHRVDKEAAFVDVALSPAGEHMAWLVGVGPANKRQSAAFVFDTVSGRLLREVKDFECPGEKIDLLDEGRHLLLKSSYSLAVESAGTHAVVNLDDRKSGFRFYFRLISDLGRPIGERRFVRALVTAPDGKSVCLQDEVGIVRRELASGKILGQWDEPCRDLAFFPDGKRALVARGPRLLVCDEKLRPMRQGDEFTDPPHIGFVRDGRLFAARRWAGLTQVWDVRQRKVVDSFVRASAPDVGRAPSSRDDLEKLIVYQDEGDMVVRDVIADRRLSRLEGVSAGKDPWKHRPSLSGDGKRVLVASKEADAMLVRWFDTPTGRELGRRRIARKDMSEGAIYRVRWYADDGSTFGFQASDGRLTLVDCATNRSLEVGFTERCSPMDDRNSPDWRYQIAGSDRWVCASRWDSTATDVRYALWDRAEGGLMRHFHMDPEPFRQSRWTAVLSADGRTMAAFGPIRGGGSEVLFHETATGRFRSAIRWPSDIHMLAFSPDGKHLAMSCADSTVLVWDLDYRLRGKSELAAPTSAAEADKMWQVLGDPDPEVMAPAHAALRRAPEEALAMLKRRLRAERGPGPGRVEQLIDDLDSANFKVRQAATEELMKLREFAPASLHAALGRSLPLEQQRRVETILIKLEAEPMAPTCLRELRALELLEQVHSGAARELVASVAGGHPGALLTREARGVLGRWEGDRPSTRGDVNAIRQ